MPVTCRLMLVLMHRLDFIPSRFPNGRNCRERGHRWEENVERQCPLVVPGAQDGAMPRMLEDEGRGGCKLVS